MRKSVLKIITLVIVLAVAVAVLTACGEDVDQAVIGGGDATAAVSSNNGLAVRQGNHLYFVNGVEESTATNSFGSVLKGSIARVDLDENGNPVADTLVVIVPKIAYNSYTAGTNKTVRGITIVGEWIYYTTPNVEKGKDGNALSTELVLMRTKINGQDTQVVKNFGKAGVDYQVAGGYCAYYDANVLYSIDLNSKKFKETKIDDSITGVLFCESSVNNAMSDVVFYTKANENSSAYSNRVFVTRLSGADKKVVIDINSYTDLMDVPLGYSISLIGYGFTGDFTKINLFYTKTVNSETLSKYGTYSYVFDSSFAFDDTKEITYTRLTNNTKVTVVSDECVVLYETEMKVYFKKDDTSFEVTDAKLPASATPLFVTKIGNYSYVYYLLDSKMYRKSVLVSDGTNVAVASSNVENVYTGGMKTDWLSPEVVGSNVFFFNSDRQNYLAYFNVSATIEDPTVGIADTTDLASMTQADKDAIAKAEEESES